MTKFYGAIGYAETIENENSEFPSVWVEQITERYYYGDVIRNIRRLQSSSGVNDDVNISNQISIVSDPYAIQNFHNIRYVEFMGSKWKVTEVEVQFPRLILNIGGVYNE